MDNFLSWSCFLLAQCFIHELTLDWFLFDTAFISHSTSLVQLKFMFQAVLPDLFVGRDLDDKLLVDVGSRLGAVLYGASSAYKIPPNSYHLVQFKTVNNIMAQLTRDINTIN